MAKSAKKQTRNQSTSKTVIYLLIVMILVAVIVLGGLAIARLANQHNDEQDNAQDTNTASEILQTEEDLKDEEKVAQSSNDAKDRFEADERTKTTAEKDASGLNIAAPVVSFVGPSQDGAFIEAGGAIPNINEPEGTCTFVFSKGDTTLTASGGILPGASYISCEAVKLEKAKFTSGTWNVKIQYKSNLSEGESEAQSFEIQ